jgi:hypothetical protein
VQASLHVWVDMSEDEIEAFTGTVTRQLFNAPDSLPAFGTMMLPQRGRTSNRRSDYLPLVADT